ncbi:hypothetical protein DSECCO2_664250 [anaerobic digester metagenome]
MEFHILTDNGDFQRVLIILDLIHHLLPFSHVGGGTVQTEFFDDDSVHAFGDEVQRHLINGFGVNDLDHSFLFHVAEKGNFVHHILGHILFHPAGDDIGMDSDAPQFMNTVLGRFCFCFTGSVEIGYQGTMDIEHIFRSDFPFHLANGLQERQGFDIADGAADLGDHHIGIAVFAGTDDPFFDFIGNMGNDLYGTAEVITFAFLLDHRVVDFTAGGVAVFGKVNVNKPFIMTDIEVGFGAVVGNEDFAVLIRAHRAGIQVNVRIEFLTDNLQAAVSQNATERRRCNAFTKRRYDTAGHKNKFGHFLYLASSKLYDLYLIRFC